MASEIKDISLAESGMRKIEWVRRNCPLLTMLAEEFEKTKPFEGKKIALSVHLEAKTAYLCLTLAAGGAKMYVTGSNPLSTQDDVAAALVSQGLEVHAKHGVTAEEYEAHIRDKKCPAHHCQALLQYVITDKCRGCTACARVCPAQAITGEVKQQHHIDPDKCLKCGACMEKCRFGAISKI